jgi:hypothetical protein
MNYLNSPLGDNYDDEDRVNPFPGLAVAGFVVLLCAAGGWYGTDLVRMVWGMFA